VRVIGENDIPEIGDWTSASDCLPCPGVPVLAYADHRDSKRVTELVIQQPFEGAPIDQWYWDSRTQGDMQLQASVVAWRSMPRPPGR